MMIKRRLYQFAKAGFAGVVLVVLLLGTSGQAFGQQTRSPEPAASETPTEASSEEAQEKDLSKQATDKGTNEVTFRPRIQLSYVHRDSRSSSVTDRAILRLDRPLLDGRLYFRVDVPYQWFDSNQPGGTTSNGFGDVYVRTGVRLLHRPKFSLFAGVNARFPSGDADDHLGRGKYQVGPIVAATVPVPALNMVFSPIVEDFQSVGGDPSQPKASYTRFSLRMDMPKLEEWWAYIQPRWIVDWTKSNKTALNLEFEGGRKLGEHYRAWVKPAVGFWGDGVAGSYNWQLEAGVRYMF